MIAKGLLANTDRYSLYVEWGTAQTIIPYDQITEKLRKFLQNYRDPHGGISMGIFPDLTGQNFSSKMNLLNPNNAEMKQELFLCLGVKPAADFDIFARAFNGLTKKEMQSRLSR